MAMTFEVIDPVTRARDGNFEVVHEKLFHVSLVTRDLKFFAHEHRVLDTQASSISGRSFPGRVCTGCLTDYYPKGGTPQLSAKYLVRCGGGQRAFEAGTGLGSREL